MIKSRLQIRRNKKTVSVLDRTLSSGKYVESIVGALSNLEATYEQQDAFEVATDGGAVVTVTDVFWFEAKAGEDLPAIEEKHVIREKGTLVRYEVLQVQDQGGGGNRLRVMTRRLR